MPTLEHNITALKNRICTACITAGRTPDTVKLLAVSKTQTVAKIQNAYDLGLHSFGENYASEAKEKIPALPADIDWHFIGPLQSNKSRFIAEHFNWIHSIDRAKLVDRLASQRPDELPPLNCLIQVNISEEDSKSGCHPNDVMALANHIASKPELRLKGLMAIPKPDNPDGQSGHDFAKMRDLSQQLQSHYPEASELSMGMSQDMETAIEHGATIIRIGTALFGPREKPEATSAQDLALDTIGHE